MNRFTTIILGILLPIMTSAQMSKKDKDVKAIKSMSGCFKVTFNFAETFNYSKDSTYKPSKTKHDYALEWAQIIKDKNNEIQLQHLLIINMEKDSYIVKHWRQDWLFENQEMYLFDKERHWKYTKFPKNSVKGQWTQKVYQVDDSPRYEGTATWVHVDGKSFWESATDAPLARREHTQRKDYNVLHRRNRHEITKKGWVHDQDNDKIIRKDGKEDFLLAQEKGYNTYTRVPDSKCLEAQKWWKENKSFWKKVRRKWEYVFKMKKDIALKKRVEKKPLYSHLFKMDPKTNKKEINKTIDKFVE